MELRGRFTLGGSKPESDFLSFISFHSPVSSQSQGPGALVQKHWKRKLRQITFL